MYYIRVFVLMHGVYSMHWNYLLQINEAISVEAFDGQYLSSVWWHKCLKKIRDIRKNYFHLQACDNIYFFLMASYVRWIESELTMAFKSSQVCSVDLYTILSILIQGFSYVCIPAWLSRFCETLICVCSKFY